MGPTDEGLTRVVLKLSATKKTQVQTTNYEVTIMLHISLCRQTVFMLHIRSNKAGECLINAHSERISHMSERVMHYPNFPLIP